MAIITAATLKLFPKPKSYATALVGLGSVKAAVEILPHMLGAGFLTAFEIFPRFALELQLKHQEETRDPLAGKHDWYALVEVSSPQAGALEGVLHGLMENGGIADAVLAHSEEQRAALWQLRERISWVQGLEGGSIKHDIAVPIALVPEFLEEANRAVTALVPDARPLPFGHLGDGNIHYNIMQPKGMERGAFLAHWEAMNEVVHGIVARYGGSIAAEHGVGQLKRGALAAFKDPVALDVMKMVKNALDPMGILNPGKVV